jgi:hypothetical protein
MFIIVSNSDCSPKINVHESSFGYRHVHLGCPAIMYSLCPLISLRARLDHGDNAEKMEESDSYSFLRCNTVWNKGISSNHSTGKANKLVLLEEIENELPSSGKSFLCGCVAYELTSGNKQSLCAVVLLHQSATNTQIHDMESEHPIAV